MGSYRNPIVKIVFFQSLLEVGARSDAPLVGPLMNYSIATAGNCGESTA
jgi:hypothetical protein